MKEYCCKKKRIWKNITLNIHLLSHHFFIQPDRQRIDKKKWQAKKKIYSSFFSFFPKLDNIKIYSFLLYLFVLQCFLIILFLPNFFSHQNEAVWQEISQFFLVHRNLTKWSRDKLDITTMQRLDSSRQSNIKPYAAIEIEFSNANNLWNTSIQFFLYFSYLYFSAFLETTSR